MTYRTFPSMIMANLLGKQEAGLYTIYLSDGGNKSSAPAKPPVPRNPNALREEKIRAYKEKQALERRLLKFVDVAAPNVDEEVLVNSNIATWSPLFV